MDTDHPEQEAPQTESTEQTRDEAKAGPQDPDQTRILPVDTVRTERPGAPQTVRAADPDAPHDSDATPAWSQVLRGDSLLGRKIADRYLLKEVIGRGGFATVYIAEDTLLERPAALKLLEVRGGEDSSRFLREARTVARLQHQNVVLLYDAGEDPLGLYLVLELITGKSLDEYVGEPLPVAEAVKITRQAAEGLAAAHELEITHRDIKPGNVLMTSDGVAKLTDFGLAQRQGETRITAEGHVVGTPAYMAPEQIEGGEIGPPADVFALGCLFHELLTGSSPFRAPTLSETFARILRGRPEQIDSALRDEEPEVCRLLESLLDKKAAKRPTAAEVADALRLWETGNELGLSGTMLVPPRRNPAAMILGAVAAVLIAVGAWFFLGDGKAENDTPTVRVEQVEGPDEILEIPDAPPEDAAEASDETDPDDAEAADPETTDSEAAEPPPSEEFIAAMQNLRDALEGHSFITEPNRFTGEEASSRRVDLDLQEVSTAAFLRETARAAGWSVVLHTSVSEAPPLTLQLEDVPWDVAAASALERQDLQATRFGDVWLIASAQIGARIAQRIAPSVVIRRPKRESPSKMADALQNARSDQGVVLYSRRLRAVVIVDRVDAFPGYSKIWAALDGGATIEAATRGYGGERVSMNLEGASVANTIRALTEIGGLNAVLHDEASGLVSIDLVGVPWDNAFELLLLSLDLTYGVNENVVEVRGFDDGDDLHVETVNVKRDAEFFRPLARSLTSQGSLDVTDDTIILRDQKDRAVWLRGLIERIDGMSRGDVEE